MIPRTSTHWSVWILGLAGFLVAFVYVMVVRPFGVNSAWSSLLIICVSGGLMYLAELRQVVRLVPGAFRWRTEPDALRVAGLQFLGLASCLVVVAFGYWLFPEYSGGWYSGYFMTVAVVAAVWLACALPYFWLVSRWVSHHGCGLYEIGYFVFYGRLRPGALHLVQMTMLSWLVRAFFLPLMWVYFQNDLDRYFRQAFVWHWDLLWVYRQVIDGLYTLDVGFVCVGYLSASRLVGTHARSTDMTLRGWVVAVVCYQPIWGLFGRLYLAYQLPNYDWWTWLSGAPVLAACWGSAIAALTAVYVWATLVFGLRFSNLSNKGVITSGPYRWHRHPAYICKNLSWWLISVPWLAAGGFSDSLRHCFMLLGVNAIYAARAWTEELHMRQDPAYLAYAQWVDQNGLFSRVTKSIKRKVNNVTGDIIHA